MDRKTLETGERKAYQILKNARENDRLASAYLFYGPSNAPLKETGLFLAKSLSCENDIFACDECHSCLRFEKGIHPDFFFIDGSKARIKKEDIQSLEERFSVSAFEKNHRLCYLIHRVENITEKAANAILKFLEEPREGQVALLTTTNLDKVLPTIRSRCLTIPLDPINPEKVREEVEGKEIPSSKKKEHISAGEAYFLSKYFPDSTAALNALEEDPSFLEGYACSEVILLSCSVSLKEAAYTILRQASGKKGAACYNWMYLMIHDIFSRALIERQEENDPFQDVIKALSKEKIRIRKADEVLKEAIAYKHVNYNPILIAGRVANCFLEE